MPTQHRFLFLPRPRHRTAGFTLVELMVVLAIMALVATSVILTLPGSKTGARTEAGRLSARIAAARDLAVIEGRPVALWLAPSGYGFDRRIDGTWQPVPGRAFQTRNWPDDIRLLAAGDRPTARLVFDRIGTSSTPLTVVLASGDSRETIKVSAVGEVTHGE